MSNFETNYQPLPFQDNGDDHHPESGVMIHVVPESSKSRWNHIDDLDSFFTRVYHYHQKHGFTCMVLQEILELVQFAFVVLFSTFLIECVDYPILFHDKVLPFNIPTYNSTGRKVTLSDAIIPVEQCVKGFNGTIIVCLLIAAFFWILRLIRVLCNFFHFFEIKAFYSTALKISENELDNMTWHEVQRRMQEVQREQQMCIHKQELTELDIYHRILRNKNYMVAMLNKSLLPVKFRVPFIGEVEFLTKGLKYNFEMILFWGPWAPFDNWRLKEDYKKFSKRNELANELAKHILWIGIANLLLCPVILLWQILYFFFNYAEVIKREPGSLGARRWSIYSRIYLRHFNELDHELNARLNRAYNLSTRYMNIFTSHILTIIVKYIVFFAGSLLAVLIILTVIDEDVLQVQHVLTAITGLGMLVAVGRAFIPDEHLVWCPEKLMVSILAHIHYMPDHWKGNAHTTQVRDEFAQLFQYKALYLIEEVLSPLVTPLILCFCLRRKALDIVDFYRNFTVEVVGVGDVCSFAQMDVRKHGHPQWVTEQTMTEANQYGQAENGKTELSLMHFTLTNPEWKPPQQSNTFITQLREQAHQHAETLPFLHEENPLFYSLHSMSSLGTGYSRIAGSLFHPIQSPSRYESSPMSQEPGPSMSGSYSPSYRPPPSVMKGGVSRTEGPVQPSGTGLLASVNPSMFNNSVSQPYQSLPNHETVPTELTSADMSFSALFMHEMHHRIAKVHSYADVQAKPTHYRHLPEMPGIKESTHEDEERTETVPLLETKLSKSS